MVPGTWGRRVRYGQGQPNVTATGTPPAGRGREQLGAAHHGLNSRILVPAVRNEGPGWEGDLLVAWPKIYILRKYKGFLIARASASPFVVLIITTTKRDANDLFIHAYPSSVLTCIKKQLLPMPTCDL